MGNGREPYVKVIVDFLLLIFLFPPWHGSDGEEARADMATHRHCLACWRYLPFGSCGSAWWHVWQIRFFFVQLLFSFNPNPTGMLSYDKRFLLFSTPLTWLIWSLFLYNREMIFSTNMQRKCWRLMDSLEFTEDAETWLLHQKPTKT